MTSVAQTLSEADIENLAHYITSLRWPEKMEALLWELIGLWPKDYRRKQLSN